MALAIRRIPASEFARDALVELYIELLSESEIQADYYNAQNTNFGALRVLNDDLVQPKAGFGRHPHRDAEIFSYIVDGELSHADSMGFKESLPRGCVQYLSAGSGITHSEMNDGTKVCRFLQIWLSPDKRGHKPQYGSKRYALDDRKNKLLHILGGTEVAPNWSSSVSDIHLQQDANVYVSEMEPQTEHTVTLGEKRQAYIVCIEGSVHVNEALLEIRDAAEIVNPEPNGLNLLIKAGSSSSHILIIEMNRQSTLT